ncbi:LYR motif-containing protein 5 isoform 4 [Scophthalmus maximus]|uniref:LYR motif containing 5a n=1 Tax=Scophthalmus maximus TaxID=52904 RepID=A0A2U9B292_SCOMX|nr:LYR motif-containing protein 5A isoform X1 [Scophthalmus maximus]XP_035505429.1 LYR motif-containing protein 5A isoform X1 [Scophthalmus maximus]XP_047191928.1 LYR motif-containing protein 5A isoform X1 [Scophthalmus maximus]AWO97898.1 LYR motif-containing protein 5 isoform 2 [Scophthalmus maximus]AWO97900.1 LYR motif-containing protein 5 isoform 4 [Scophthalmus maximus]
MASPLKGEVMRLYKTLLYLGREYPQGAAYFRERLKAAFVKNRDETDPDKIRQLVARGDFVIKELEALYFLRKYRAMKKRQREPIRSRSSFGHERTHLLKTH